jgi:hypothetical protein
MATLVLTTVGAIVGGPAGAIVGAAIGNRIDQSLFAPKGRSGPRLSDLSVQGSAYGTPIPRLYGRVRASGNIIWSRGLKETARSSGGKRSGGRTTSYSYSASFAVLVSARPIVRIERIWADGKVLRNASGELTSPGQIRFYLGDERHVADPLVTAAEGAGDAPAYRGRAYVVFEDLELGEFANRIPNLSFEVIADETDPTVGTIATDLLTATSVSAETSGLAYGVTGFFAARPARLADWVGTLSLLTPIRIRETGGRLLLADDAVPTDFAIDEGDIVDPVKSSSRIGRAAAAATSIAIGYLDPARDFQPGLQRALRSAPVAAIADAIELPAAIDASIAKAAATAELQRRWTRRTSLRRVIGVRGIAASPGDRILVDGAAVVVRNMRLEAMRVELELEPLTGATPAVPAEPGRADGNLGLPQGTTVAEVFESYPLGDEPAGLLRVRVAAAGSGAGWRRAGAWFSRDGGANWQDAGTVGGPAAIGTLAASTGSGDSACWDDVNAIEVAMVSPAIWLESRSDLSVLAGANLARVGNELIQFGSVEAIAAKRFRLTRLLRGRRGSESSVHPAGTPFILLSADGVLPVDLPIDAGASTVRFKVVAPHEAFLAAPEQLLTLTGRGAAPLAPVHLTARRLADGSLALTWIRRSRFGFGWPDSGDVPLGEVREAYICRLAAGSAVIERQTDLPQLTISAAEQVDTFGSLPDEVDVTVAQVGEWRGEGAPARRIFHFGGGSPA